MIRAPSKSLLLLLALALALQPRKRSVFGRMRPRFNRLSTV